MKILVVGLDLAGVEHRPTGFCRLKDLDAVASLVFTDEEILQKIVEIAPSAIAIDAPLSLPPGRKSIEERTGVHLRESDKELLRRRIKFFPITLGPMRKLTQRGINLRKLLEASDFVVMEAYPGGAQDILRIPRKQQGVHKLRAGLEGLGIQGLDDRMSDHELDAVTCAYVAKLFLEGKTITYGLPCDGIVMPKNET
jgi:predicted nuclease with RNAse H fold